MVEFSLFEGNSSELEDELSHGRVDLIICFQPIMMEDIEVVPLAHDRLTMGVPRAFTDSLFGERADEMRRQFANGVDLNVFSQMPFVLLKRGNRVRSMVDQYFNRHYFKPKIALETENTVTTLAMARSNMGIIICPELFIRDIHIPAAQKDAEMLDFFPLTDPDTVSRLVLGYRRDRYLSHYAKRFIEITQESISNNKYRA